MIFEGYFVKWADLTYLKTVQGSRTFCLLGPPQDQKNSPLLITAIPKTPSPPLVPTSPPTSCVPCPNVPFEDLAGCVCADGLELFGDASVARAWAGLL